MNYRTYLTEDILPFWLKYAFDEEEGGIFTSLDEYGNVYDTDKNIWFIGRALWSFSLAYRLVEQKKEYMNACDNLFGFFAKCTLPDGRLPHRAKRNGECIVHRNLYYSEGFAAMGCAQYYRISQNEEAKKRAEEYFDISYNQYKDPVMRIPVANGDAPYVSFGLEMFMLSVAQFVRNAGIRADECDELASSCIHNMQNNGHILEKEKTVREYIPTTDKKLPSPKDMFVCPGHIYEAAWFVMCEGVVKDDDDIKNFGIKLMNYAMPEDFHKYTSLIPTGINDPNQETYIWWPQWEAIIAHRLAYNICGEQKYLDISKQIEEYTFAHFADYKNGEWYTEVDCDGNVVDRNKGTFIKGPFHIPRTLFALVSLEETGDIGKYMS